MNELNMSEKQIARQDLYGVGIELYGLSYDLHRDDCEMENSRPMQEREPEMDVEAIAESFDIDREARPEKQDPEEEQERERDDDGDLGS